MLSSSLVPFLFDWEAYLLDGTYMPGETPQLALDPKLSACRNGALQFQVLLRRCWLFIQLFLLFSCAHNWLGWAKSFLHGSSSSHTDAGPTYIQNPLFSYLSGHDGAGISLLFDTMFRGDQGRRTMCEQNQCSRREDTFDGIDETRFRQERVSILIATALCVTLCCSAELLGSARTNQVREERLTHGKSCVLIYPHGD